MANDRNEGSGDAPRASCVPVSRWWRTARALVPCILRRGILLAFVWWILVEGDSASWYIGAPAVLLSAIASTALTSPVTFLWYEFFRFVPFFLFRSLLGGVDVAWRALHPNMPIEPILIEYPLRLPLGLPRAFLASTVSLLPGTLSAGMGSKSLTVHVLSRRKDILSDLETLEQKVGALFAVTVPDCRQVGPN